MYEDKKFDIILSMALLSRNKGTYFWIMYYSISCSYLQPLSSYWRIVQFVNITVCWVVKPHLQGYRNRYNIFDYGHKKELSWVLKKKSWSNSAIIVLHQTPGQIRGNLAKMSKSKSLFISQTLQLPLHLSIIVYLFAHRWKQFCSYGFYNKIWNISWKLFSSIDFSILWLEYDWMLKTNQNASGFMNIFQAILKTILFFWNSRGMD